MSEPEKPSIRAFRSGDQAAVIALWRAAELIRPWNDPARDIARKLTVQADLFLIAELSGQIIGSVMAGFDGHRGWVNYLAVDPSQQRRGIGRMLMAEVELRLVAMGCPKLNLQVRPENSAVIDFYERLGYLQEPRVSFGKRLIED